MGRVARDIIKKRVAVAMLVTSAWVAAQEQGVADAKLEASDAKSDAAAAYGAANSAAAMAIAAEQKANSAAQVAVGAALTNEQQQLLLDGLRTTDTNFVLKVNKIESDLSVATGDLTKFKEETNDELDNIIANFVEQETLNQSLEDNGYAKKN